MSPLALEVVTPAGRMLAVDGCDRVVLRRREASWESGSEVVIMPGHAPMLVRMPACELRYMRQGRIGRLEVGGGYCEVYGAQVTVMADTTRAV